MHRLRLLRSGGLPVPIAHTGSYAITAAASACDTETRRHDSLELRVHHALGVTRLALRQRLAHAQDRDAAQRPAPP